MMSLEKNTDLAFPRAVCRIIPMWLRRLKRLHADSPGLSRQCHEESFDHYHRSVDDNTKVYCSHTQEVSTHSTYVQGYERKEQCQRDDRRDDDCSAPVLHEQQNDERDEDDTL